MAMIFTIDAIEGNSHIGVPVFSRSAKKANYDYIVFSPPKGAKLLFNQPVQEEDPSQKALENNLNQLQIISRIRNLETQQAKLLQQQKLNSNRQLQPSELSPISQGSKHDNREQNRIKDKKIKLDTYRKSGDAFGKSFSTSLGRLHSMNRKKRNLLNGAPLFDRMVSRDKYQKVHELKTLKPKNGNYNPKFELIEKRVIAPIYGEDFKRRGSEARRAQQIKLENFNKQEICNRIMKALESSRGKGEALNATHEKSKYETISTKPYENLSQGDSPKKTFQAQQFSTLVKDLEMSQMSQNIKSLNNMTQHRKNNSVHNLEQNQLAYQRSKNKSLHFQFSNQPLTETFSLVKEYPDSQLIKDDISYHKLVEPRVRTRDIFRTLPRRSFVSPKDPPNENRFDPPIEILKLYTTINQSVLSSQRRTKDFNLSKVRSRDESLIQKGGLHNKDISAKNEVFFDMSKKDKILTKIDTGIIKFERRTHRTFHNSIYKKEVPPDYYDTQKIEKGYKRTSTYNTPKSMIEMSKQPKRDFTRIYKQMGGMYENIQRENERQDYLKKLLEGHNSAEVELPQ